MTPSSFPPPPPPPTDVLGNVPPLLSTPKLFFFSDHPTRMAVESQVNINNKKLGTRSELPRNIFFQPLWRGQPVKPWGSCARVMSPLYAWCLYACSAVPRYPRTSRRGSRTTGRRCKKRSIFSIDSPAPTPGAVPC